MTARIGIVVLILVLSSGISACTTKLVRIDSDPGMARIYVNGEYAGITPMYYRFRDTWEPWPLEPDDNYTVEAKKDSGYVAAEKVYDETDDWLDLSYIPHEIMFKMMHVPEEQ